MAIMLMIIELLKDDIEYRIRCGYLDKHKRKPRAEQPTEQNKAKQYKEEINQTKQQTE